MSDRRTVDKVRVPFFIDGVFCFIRIYEFAVLAGYRLRSTQRSSLCPGKGRGYEDRARFAWCLHTKAIRACHLVNPARFLAQN